MKKTITLVAAIIVCLTFSCKKQKEEKFSDSTFNLNYSQIQILTIK